MKELNAGTKPWLKGFAQSILPWRNISMFLRKIKVRTKKGVKVYYQVAETYKDLRGVERTKVLAHLGTVEKMLDNHRRLKEGVLLE